MKKDAYRLVARWYDAIFRPVNAGLFAVGRKMRPPAAGLAVLDVGCGTGMQLERYQRGGCAVAGIDPSPSMLAEARAKLSPEADLRLGDAAAMPFDADAFDLVTATLVLHEMAPPTRDAVLDEMKRVRRADGHILIIDYHPGPLRPLRGWFNKAFITVSEIAAGREHFRNYRHFMAHAGLPALVRKHGLTVVRERVVSGGNLIVALLH